jgi:hypothetical protein
MANGLLIDIAPAMRVLHGTSDIAALERVGKSSYHAAIERVTRKLSPL